MVAGSAVRYRDLGGLPPPTRFFRKLSGRPGAFLLDSSMRPGAGEASHDATRWSFFGTDPFLVFSASGERSRTETLPEIPGSGKGRDIPADYDESPAPRSVRGGTTGNPLRVLAELMRDLGFEREGTRPPRQDGPAPFAGGAVGFFGYDLKHRLEAIPEPRPARETDDVWLGFYAAVGAWDHRDEKLWIVGRDFGDARPGRADSAMDALERRIVDACEGSRAGDRRTNGTDDGRLSVDRQRSGGATPIGRPGRLDAFGGGWRASFTPNAYLDAVRAVKRHIERGDIYQANLTQRFESDGPGEPFCTERSDESGASGAYDPGRGSHGANRARDVQEALEGWNAYLRLREISPAPFAAFARCGDLEILSASPERFLRREGDRIETRPIKGTRPRGRSPDEDERLARELRDSEKDAAELVMIIDVERNDLGRVCRAGSIEVPELMRLESYATVHHLVSTVRGRLRPDVRFEELLSATFPGGSITGAPKIRAMEILDDLEPTRRGPYTGAFGWIDGSGDLDLQIAIRTAYRGGGKTWFQVGGGITTASDPEAEYEETLDKGRALASALLPPPAAGNEP